MCTCKNHNLCRGVYKIVYIFVEFNLLLTLKEYATIVRLIHGIK